MSEVTPDIIEQHCRTLIPGYDPWARCDGYRFDHEAAMRMVLFFNECLTLTNAKWAGRPFILQPWQMAIVGNIFGWKSITTGFRRYRKSLLFTARKSGKTELAAGIGLSLLFTDGEPAPEIVSAAGNADQATRIFNAASTMVRNEPELLQRSRLFARSIECQANQGYLKVINAAAKTKHGGNLHAALIDELHVHPDAELVDVLETSMRARSQPLVLFTTTAGQDPETIAGEVYNYACGVRDGLIDDPTFLPVIYECPKDGDIADPANWRKAQPNLGVTVPEEEYARDLREALQVPRKMHTFRQLSLNQWVESAAAWIGLEEWKACADPMPLQSLKGKRATLGIDLSSTTDTTAVVAAVEDGDNVRVFPFIFIPRDNAEGRYRRQKRDRAPYLSWIAQGHITATDGNAVDYEFVERRIMELADLLDIVELQADPYNASDLLGRLMAAGLPVKTVRQGWSLAAATKETERLILTRGLAHPDNPAFSWQVLGTVLHQDRHENCWPDKGRSTRRIDAAVAMVMAINALKFGDGVKPAPIHYYEKHPSLVVL